MFLQSHPPTMLAMMLAAVLVPALPSHAQQRRARPPEYPAGAFRGVFFEDVSQALRGERPRIGALEGSADTAASVSGDDAGSGTETPGEEPVRTTDRWRSLADPVHLEDEVKRLKLRYDALITTPGKFKSGGFREARSTLSILAVLMAVVAEYEGSVRFQRDAAVARDLFARAATNVSAGSTEAFNEANQRKADMQDLVSGTGLGRADSAGPTDWALTGSRPQLMEYLDGLNDTLQDGSVNAAAVAESEEELQRSAAMVAVIAEVLKQEGMDEAEDADYRQMAAAMQRAAIEIRRALDQNDADAARRAVGTLGQSCNACHEQYR